MTGAGGGELSLARSHDSAEAQADEVAEAALRSPTGHWRSGGRPLSGERPPPATPTAIALRMAAGVVSTPGRPLPRSTQDQLGSRMGRDFSSVRVHTDPDAAMSACALHAHAYTVGDHLVFAEGRHRPGTAAGDRLIAHEVAHVAQQGATVGPGASPTVVQRFEAGPRGHGGIEEEALRQAGFQGSLGEGEIGAVYFGNWLRDFSQIGDARHTWWLRQVLNILSMGIFNRPVTAEELGGYVASEHLDNPLGGGSVEDPIESDWNKGFTDAMNTEQWKWHQAQQDKDFKKAIDQKKARSHLPDYLEVGKEHAKRELTSAARLGRSPDGLAAMGNGLHAMEDYFAHSNFTDACLYMLVADGSLSSQSPIYTKLAARGADLNYDPSGGVAGGAARPAIMTGTVRETGNKDVSLLEELRSEIKSGWLTKAAIIGSARLSAKKAGVAGATVGGVIGKGIGGALGVLPGAAIGGVSGALHGAAEGWREGHGIWAPLKAIGGFFRGLFSGMAGGAVEGATIGANVLGAAGAYAGGTVVGGIAGLAAGSSLAAVIALIDAGIAVYVGRKRRYDDKMRQYQRDAYRNDRKAEQTQTAPKRAGAALDPNHSQLAKDDLDHPIHTAARALAVHVDSKMGRLMIEAWDSGAAPKQVKALEDAVDEFVSNPADRKWWRQPLLQELTKEGEFVKQGPAG
jgi:hypothetical protein